MSAHDDVIDNYANSLIEPDESRRIAFLELVWADDCTVILPDMCLRGRADVNAHISRIQREYYGAATPTLIGTRDVTDRFLRFEWRILTPLGDVVNEGVNFADLDEDGRITRLVVFFGFRPPSAS